MDLTPYIKQAAQQYEKMRVGEFTQEEVAAELGVSTQALRSWENGRSEPKLSKFIGMCRVMGYEAHEVLRDIEHPERMAAAGDLDAMRERLMEYVAKATDADFIRGAYAITYKMQRSVIMQLFLAYIGLPLRQQQLIAGIILDQWEFCRLDGDLRPDVPMPNVETLRKAHQHGRNAALEGENNYIIKEG